MNLSRLCWSASVQVASCLTSERYLGILLQVFLQFLVVHVLAGGKRGGDGRVDPADVQPGSCGVSSSQQGAQTSPWPDAQHGDRLTELPAQLLLTRDS